ncbi:CLUMA_CG005358, isoform A [Clunio marinus]|uniref:CLUMA_CG005358, isoform A n=1 Tax=Clunio marinus TaxID=568069 RepID=A0A1J1HUN9_9DIPT|nr:CLUMA_CG005358, isoform A [Clunio marinus]
MRTHSVNKRQYLSNDTPNNKQTYRNKFSFKLSEEWLTKLCLYPLEIILVKEKFLSWVKFAYEYLLIVKRRCRTHPTIGKACRLLIQNKHNNLKCCLMMFISENLFRNYIKQMSTKDKKEI